MTETTKLVPSDPASEHRFGESVAVFGDTALVGSPTAGADAGAAYVFTRGTGWPSTLTEDVKLAPSDGSPGDFFGEGVALSGSRMVVGAPHNHDEGHPLPNEIGAAYLFVDDGTGWSEEAKYVGGDSLDFDHFGKSAGVSDDLAILGAPRDFLPSGRVGSAYLFDADLGVLPGITITKRTNGADADDPDGARCPDQFRSAPP